MFRDKNRGFSDFILTLSTLYHFEVCQKLFILLSDFILNLSTLCHFRKFSNSSSCYYYKSNCQQNFLHNYWNVLICCTDLACLWINYNKARTWYLVHIKWFWSFDWILSIYAIPISDVSLPGRHVIKLYGSLKGTQHSHIRY